VISLIIVFNYKFIFLDNKSDKNATYMEKKQILYGFITIRALNQLILTAVKYLTNNKKENNEKHNQNSNRYVNFYFFIYFS